MMAIAEGFSSNHHALDDNQHLMGHRRLGCVPSSRASHSL
jgi:hypothetical protein